MAFYFRNADFDLGELHVENLFITDFMPLASGNYVKVYLLGQMIAKNNPTNRPMDNLQLSNLLQLSLQDVLDAWKFWEDQGIVIRHPQEKHQDVDIEFLSIRSVYIENNYELKGKKTALSQSPAPEAAKISPANSYQTLKKEIEKIIHMPLYYNDLQLLCDFYDHYFPDIEIIKKAVSICYNERKHRNMKAVKALLNQWLEVGLKKIEEVNAYVESESNRGKNHKEMIRALGLGYRMPTVAEVQHFNRWMDIYQFEAQEIIAFMVHFSKRSNHLNLNYLESIFESLFQKGIRTLEEYLANESSQKKKSPSTASARPLNKRQNQTVEREKSYSEDELEAMLIGKKRK